ncbi:MAG: hypothetical protein GYA31_00775 [Parcubacteria group bacterium]|nr:hypothetical protein [Parcubacteria group bacterium]
MKINAKYLKGTIEQIETVIESKHNILIIGHDLELNTKLFKIKRNLLPAKLREQLKCYRCHAVMPHKFMVLIGLDIIMQDIELDNIIKIVNVTNPEIEIRDEIQALNIPLAEVGWFYPFQALSLNIKLQDKILRCSCGTKNDFSFIYLKKRGGEEWK